jgi:hypothetical protein
MKLIFFSFKHRYRIKDLNNFLKNRIIGNYLILNLSGPFKHYISKLLMLFNIGKAISCDGRPIIKDKVKGINFWMRGTCLDIPTEYRHMNNNFVTITNPIIDNKNKILQVFPMDLKKNKINQNLKIIFVSKTITSNNLENDTWVKFKDQLLDNFSLLDNLDFWKKNFPTNDDNKNYEIYKNLKIILRHEIIIKIKQEFKDKLLLVGDDWVKYFVSAKKSTYNLDYIKKLYRGNLCLDLGSVLGSVSLYSRSNQIIESGGLILQSRQIDYLKIWGDNSNNILFYNMNSLLTLLNKLFDDRDLCNSKLNDIYLNFKNSKKNVEKTLTKIF